LVGEGPDPRGGPGTGRGVREPGGRQTYITLPSNRIRRRRGKVGEAQKKPGALWGRLLFWTKRKMGKYRIRAGNHRRWVAESIGKRDQRKQPQVTRRDPWGKPQGNEDPCCYLESKREAWTKSDKMVLQLKTKKTMGTNRERKVVKNRLKGTPHSARRGGEYQGKKNAKTKNRGETAKGEHG